MRLPMACAPGRACRCEACARNGASGDCRESAFQAGNVDPAIKNAQESINSLRENYTLKMMDIARYTDQDDSEDTRCISILEARLKVAEDKLAEITNTRSLKSKTDQLIGILDLSYKVSSKKFITRSIKKRQNKKHKN